EQDTCTLQFDVIDTGIGIQEEHQARLFHSFEQAESSTTRKFGGTGLGLAISKRIIGMMGGEIWLVSEPGEGSAFSFSVKVQQPEPEAGGAPEMPDGGPEAHALPAMEAGCFEGFRILLAEDLEINREIILALLEPTRLAIDCAENGQEAVNLFLANRSRYSLIFMDIQMPEMDGYEATRRIRAAEGPAAAGIPIVALSANAFREDVDKSLKAGMNAHLGKPLDFDEMLDVLRKYLR
ncbi:MAG: response regulator, partial [Oscillospiraceae bacterium]|nr:response regulator [Oscillospiraceae bacterium]